MGCLLDWQRRGWASFRVGRLRAFGRGALPPLYAQRVVRKREAAEHMEDKSPCCYKPHYNPYYDYYCYYYNYNPHYSPN